jgi:hypothetical protein
MILIAKKDGILHFRIWICYWVGGFRFITVNELFSTDDWSRSQIRAIQKEIKLNFKKKFE